MRIAFDVKGTIEGPRQAVVLALLEALQAAGHTVIVWSNSYGYAVDAVKDHDLTCEPHSKRTWSDCDGYEGLLCDLCIDDDSSQTWLASKRFIWVHHLPETVAKVEELAKRITNEDWANIKCQTSRHLSESV